MVKITLENKSAEKFKLFRVLKCFLPIAIDHNLKFMSAVFFWPTFILPFVGLV